MITAKFTCDADGLRSVEVSGHAGYGDKGEDIVCASVTSAVQLVCNGIIEVIKLPARLVVEDNLIRLVLPEGDCAKGAGFLQSLLLHLQLLEQDYPKYLTTTVLEV